MNEIFETYIFNVGHGDNILLKFSTGTWGLIDFHFTDDQVEPPSLSHLKNLTDKQIIIEFIHITHYHYDHTKGLDNFLKWVESEKGRVILKKIWLPGTTPPQRMQQLLRRLAGKKSLIREAIKKKTMHKVNRFIYHYSMFDDKMLGLKKAVTIRPLVNVQTFQVNDEYDTLCLSPSATTVSSIAEKFENYLASIVNNIATREPYVDQNTLSTVLIFIRQREGCKGAKFVFGGDATIADWHRGLNDFDEKKRNFSEDLQTLYGNFIKVSHHGSKHSSSEKIWQSLLRPSNKELIHTFFSCGDSKYPNKETLKQLDDVAKHHKAKIEKHAFSNKAITLKKYEEVPYKVRAEESEKVRVKIENYNMGRIKESGRNEVIAYHYSYDFKTATAKVIKHLSA